jgi:hypothetical protein
MKLFYRECAIGHSFADRTALVMLLVAFVRGSSERRRSLRRGPLVRTDRPGRDRYRLYDDSSVAASACLHIHHRGVDSLQGLNFRGRTRR